MNTSTRALIAIAALGAAGLASAHGRVGVSIGFGFPVAAPVYVAPAPVYPVYVQPQPVYVPAPAYYAPSYYGYEPAVVVRPAPVIVYGAAYGRSHRHHRRAPHHGRHDRD